MLDTIHRQPHAFDLLWFSDEKIFYLDTPKNRKNTGRWMEKDTRCDLDDFDLEERDAHPPKLMVWTAISTRGVIRPYFFDSNVDQFAYQRMFDVFFVEKAEEYDHDLGNSWFQQDGAQCHCTNNSLEMIQIYFRNRIISRNFEFGWPPHSPDLSLLDFFLWGYIESIVTERR